jgi:hypothetical protein
MKKATCRDMRGACDAKFQGETPEEIGQGCRQHVMEMVQSGDEAHKIAMDDMMKLGKEEQEKWYEDFRSRFDSLQDA